MRDRLVVEVEDAEWQKQLFHLRYPILQRAHEVLGGDLVRDLEFRIAIPKRGPQQAESLSGAGPARRGSLQAETLPGGASASADEADGIRDPVFRLLYQQARKKAPA